MSTGLGNTNEKHCEGRLSTAKYGVGILPDYITHINALDEFQTYFVNPYIDHHCHKFLSE